MCVREIELISGGIESVLSESHLSSRFHHCTSLTWTGLSLLCCLYCWARSALLLPSLPEKAQYSYTIEFRSIFECYVSLKMNSKLLLIHFRKSFQIVQIQNPTLYCYTDIELKSQYFGFSIKSSEIVLYHNIHDY